MLKYFLIFSTLLASIQINAHQADVSSTMLIEKSPNEWVLQIRSALTAFEYVIKTHKGENAYTSPQEFEELIIDHLKNTITLKFNEKQIQLKDAHVKIGHETSVVLALESGDSIVNKIEIENKSFLNIPKSKSALIVFKKGIPNEQFILDAKNNYAATLSVEAAKITLETAATQEVGGTKIPVIMAWVLGLFLMVLLLGIMTQFKFRPV